MSSAAFGRVLFGGWWILMALLPIGHLTGLRNTWSILVVIATLAWLRADAWRGLPARRVLLALLAWCALSIAWSTEPAISFGKWRSDLLIPLLAYAAAFGYVRRTRSLAALIGGLVTGLVALALVSLFAVVAPHLPADVVASVRTEPFPNIAQPMPVWYPGVGDASMAASLAAGLLIFARRLSAAIARPVVTVAWVALAVVVLVANNRNAQIGIPLVALACLWATRRRERAADAPRRSRAGRTLVVAVVLLASTLAVAARLESGARERLEALHVPLEPGRSAFVQLTSRDTRPMIWSYYTRLAMQAPWIGVGFGRTVPGLHYHTEDDRALALVETNAYSHAHNLFLNWWLQTGLVGVVLLSAALVAVVVRASRNIDAPSSRAAGFAVVAIVALMLVRDATDDFLVYGMATMFWMLLGGVAGLASSSCEASGGCIEVEGSFGLGFERLGIAKPQVDQGAPAE